jgi:Rho GTPase-activating protein RGD1
MSLRIADDAVSPGSSDGHGIVGSPTATNGPHPFQSHPAQSSTSASTSNSPNVAIPSRPSLSSKSSSSPPRSSTEVDFVGKSPPSATARWRNSLSATQRADTTSSTQSDSNTVVEPGFDESVLRALCDLDVSVMPKSRLSPISATFLIKCGVPLLLDRIKQSMISCRVSLCRHAALAFR